MTGSPLHTQWASTFFAQPLHSSTEVCYNNTYFTVWGDTMEQLEKYCMKKCQINGLDTYILSPEHYGDLLQDSKLLKALHHSDFEFIKPFIDIASTVTDVELFPALTYHKGWTGQFAWIPTHCYKSGDKFVHVHFRSTWMCRECGHWHSGTILMPTVEADATFYSCTENRCPPVPSIFRKLPCKNCGKPLQNHLILI